MDDCSHCSSVYWAWGRSCGTIVEGEIVPISEIMFMVARFRLLRFRAPVAPLRPRFVMACVYRLLGGRFVGVAPWAGVRTCRLARRHDVLPVSL